MEHPNIRLEIELRYEPEFESYVPQAAGPAEDSSYQEKLSFDECADAIMFFADFLSSHNLLEAEDRPDDMSKVSVGTEQLLLEALYLVHGRWHAPEPEDEDELPPGNGNEVETP